MLHPHSRMGLWAGLFQQYDILVRYPLVYYHEALIVRRFSIAQKYFELGRYPQATIWRLAPVRHAAIGLHSEAVHTATMSWQQTHNSSPIFDLP